MAGGGGGGDGEPEFQVAPMIDVLLTILIFFMTITSAQVLKIDKSINLPLAPDAQKKDDKRAETVVNVRKKGEDKGEFMMDDKVYAKAEEMIPALKAAKALGEKKLTPGMTNPEFRAIIRGDKDVPALYVSQAMNACAEAGIADISFSAVNKE